MTQYSMGDLLPHWTQFEDEVLERLREARRALASASGMASADGMTTWSLRAHELAGEVEKLTNEILVNKVLVQREKNNIGYGEDVKVTGLSKLLRGEKP